MTLYNSRRRDNVFSKKKSDAEYHAMKEKVLKNFEMYQHVDEYENPHVTRDKWSEEVTDAKTVYKLSKKYADIEADVGILKNVFEQSKEREQFYSHVADALDFKFAVLHVKTEFEEYDDAIKDGVDLEKGEEWYTKWKNLFEKTEKLYKDRNKYANDEYDSEKLPDIYYDSMFYYAFYTFYLINCNENIEARGEVLRKQKILSEALKITGNYKGCKNELKFRLLRGVIHFDLSQEWVEYAKAFGHDPSSIDGKFESERRSSYVELKILADGSKINRPCSWQLIEWHLYNKGVWCAYSYLLYNCKDLKRAHDLLQNELDQQSLAIKLEMVSKDFADELGAELALFQKSVFGWKYLG